MNMIKRVSGSLSFALLLATLLVLPAQNADAQSIGYTNQELLLANMPQMEEVNQQLQQEMMAEQQEFQQEQQEFQQMVEQFQEQQSLLSPERRQEREQELREKQAEIQQSAQQRDEMLAQRERELMQPLLEEMRDAINEVASNQNLDLVVRSQALLYVNEDNVVDITEEVAQRLGIEVDPDAVQQPQTPDTPASDFPGQNQ